MEQSIKLFIILGTKKFPFKRLIQAIEKIVENGIYQKDEVLIQSGIVQDKSSLINITSSIPVDEFNRIIEYADIIITHAGVNSILSCMKLQKKFIVVPRLKQYGEHVDNHQTEIAKVIEKQFNVLVLNDIDKLLQCLVDVRDHVYEPWCFDNKMLLKSISDFIVE